MAYTLWIEDEDRNLMVDDRIVAVGLSVPEAATTVRISGDAWVRKRGK